MSNVKRNEFKFTWVIENFSFCNYDVNQALRSPLFIVEYLGESSWYLILYPRGECKSKVGFVSCFLCKWDIRKCEKCSFPFVFRIEMIGASGKKLKTYGGHYKPTDEVYEWGSSEFLEIEQITRDAETSTEDTLTVCCYLHRENSKGKIPTGRFARTKIVVDRVSFKMNAFVYGFINVRKTVDLPEGRSFECVINRAINSFKINIIKVASSDEKCHSVECKITLLYADVICVKKAAHFFNSKDLPETWTFPGDAIFAALQDYKDFYVTFFWEFSCTNGIELSSLTSGIQSSSSAIFGQSSNFSTLQKDMQCMFTKNKLSDVKLRAESRVIEAHKYILSARSTVFSAMVDKMEDIIDIVDIDYNTLRLLLEFLYTDTVSDIDYEQAKVLMVAAEKYKVVSLKDMCASFIHSKISVRNACEILALADVACHDDLKSFAVQFIVTNSTIILRLPQWPLWMKRNMKLATEILTNLTSNLSTLQTAEAAIEQELMIKATTSAAESSTTARGSKYPSTSAASLLRGNQNPPSLNHASSGHKSETTVGYGNQNAASLNYASSGHKSETTLRNGNQNAASSEEHRHETLNPSENNVGKCPIDSGK